jgi:hypothetical protein
MKITKAEQIRENCKWITPNLLVFDLHSEILNKSFPVELYFNPQKEEKIIREETIRSIIEFQGLGEKDIIEIHDAIWFFITKYKSEADRVKMGIKHKSDAISKCEITGVGFANEDDLDHSFFNIFVNAEWDREHGIAISYFNGELDDVE